jgi:hypothetical protein
VGFSPFNLIFLRTMSDGSRRLAVLVGLAVSLAFAPSALATAGEPVIGSVSASNITERGATLEAQVDPQGSATTYEIWLECQVASLQAGAGCGSGSEPVPGSPRGHDVIAVGSENRTVGVTVTGLHPGYSYWYGVLVTNSAGKVESLHHLFQTSSPGSCTDVCGSGEPYETHLEPWVNESIGNWGAGGTAREAERQAKAAKELEAQHAKEREEQEFKEAAAKTTEAAARKQREEQEQDTGGLSLVGTSIIVQSNGAALVRLNCLGTASCRGKLTLTAKGAAKARDAKGKKAGAVPIGTVSYSIAGDETKSVNVKLNAAGRALLSADRGRCGASLSILELAPSPQNTQMKAVHLVQRKTANERKS